MLKRKFSLSYILDDVYDVSEVDDIAIASLLAGSIDGIPAAALDAALTKVTQVIAASAAVVENLSLGRNQTILDCEPKRA